MSNKTLEPLGDVRYLGLDVSALSGEIDFATVRASGRAAVYIRASVADDYADPNFDANYISARENGLLAGAYHVLTARTPEEARAQARFFAQTVAGRAMQLRPALVFDCLAGLTAANANAIALAFLETVEAELGSAAIRADAETAQSLWSAAIASRFPLWLTGCDAAVGGNWAGWSGRQYAAHARVEGVSGPAGLDGFTDGMLAGAAAAPANDAAVPTLASAAALASAAQTYTVRRGDTLSEIAARFGTTVNELVRLNNIADPDRIYEGDRLIIRAGTGDGNTYTVQRGDTLSEIAARFGTTVNELVRLNNIADRDRIYPGQVLILRESGSVTPPSGATTYTVQRNDNLTEIAARFGTTVAELVRLNNIANPNLIYPGQVLIIRENGGSVDPAQRRGDLYRAAQRQPDGDRRALWHHRRGTRAPQQHRQPESHLSRSGADHPRERRQRDPAQRRGDLYRAAQRQPDGDRRALWHHRRGTRAPQQHRQPESHLSGSGADHPRERRLHASLRHDDLHRAAQ